MSASSAKNSLSEQEVLEIIEHKSAEHNVKLPDTWKDDFQRHVPLRKGVTSFSAIDLYICRKIVETLEHHEELGDTYGEIHGQIAFDTRVQIAKGLGFDQFMNEPQSILNGHTPKQILELFFDSLTPGQTWQGSAIFAWKLDGEPVGKNLSNLISPKIGPLNRRVVEVMLGDEATEVFARNPCDAREERVKTKYDARRYFKEFLASLDEGEEWGPESMKDWNASDGTSGYAIWTWFFKRLKQDENRKAQLKSCLGPEGAALLKRNPFSMKTVKIRGWEGVKNGLLAFLETIPAGKAWSTVDLWAWKTERWNGHSLYKYVAARGKRFNRATVRELLGDKADILDKKPLDIRERKVRTAEDAKRYLTLFLETLQPGEPWSPMDVRYCEEIGKDGPTGATLMQWLRVKCRDEDSNISEESIRKILGADSERILQEHPFQRVRMLTSTKIARSYFITFLYALEEDEPWSIVDMQEWGEIQDGVSGINLHSWMTRNMASVDEKNLRELLGDKQNVLDIYPFEQKLRKQVVDLASARQYLKEILATFPKGQIWRPVDLMRYGRMADNKPAGRSVYKWIIRNVPSKDGAMTEDLLRTFLGDERGILEEYPFERALKIKSVEDAKIILNAYLSGLEEGESWGPKKINQYGQIGEGGLLGTTLYQWLIRNVRHEDEVDWLFVLCKMVDPEALRRNPFKHRFVEGVKVQKTYVPLRRPATKFARKHDSIFELDAHSSMMADPSMDPEQILIVKQGFEAKIRKLDPLVRDKIRRFRQGEDLPEHDIEMLLDTLEHLADPSTNDDEGHGDDENSGGWYYEKDGRMVYKVT